MTQSLLVLATAIASFLFVDPVLQGALVKTAFAKTIILVVGVGAFGFHIFARAVVARRRAGRAMREVVSAWWPLMLLAVFIVSGSLYARFVGEIKETFLGMGLGMLFLPMVAIAVRSSDSAFFLMKSLAAIYIATVISMYALLFSTPQRFHESIFLAAPIGAYFLIERDWNWFRVFFGLALIAACVYSLKNTTFIMVLFNVAACLLLKARRRVDRGNRLAASLWIYCIAVCTCACGAALFLIWRQFRQVLPSGNVEYRIEMYGIAWRRFLASPIWGTGFAESAVNYFRLYKVEVDTQNLPTHSDILDILAHGGTIAFGLWLMVAWRIAVIEIASARVLIAARADQDVRPWQWLFVLGLIQVDAMITYAVNPPLVNPVQGFWIWGGAGLMWALHRELTNPIGVTPKRTSLFRKSTHLQMRHANARRLT